FRPSSLPSMWIGRFPYELPCHTLTERAQDLCLNADAFNGSGTRVAHCPCDKSSGRNLPGISIFGREDLASAAVGAEPPTIESCCFGDLARPHPRRDDISGLLRAAAVIMAIMSRMTIMPNA